MDTPKLSFISNETHRIEFDGGWVDVKTGITFRRYMELMKGFDADDPASAAISMLGLLKETITGWSVETPCNEESIEQLSVETIVYLGEKVVKLFTPDKKKSV